MKSLREQNLDGKTVLVRVDFNVPIEDGVVTDRSRIEGTLPTIRFLMESGAKTILISHLGRPKGKPVKELSMEPVAKALSETIHAPVKFIGSDRVVDEKVKEEVKKLKPGEVAVLENTRFRPDEEDNGSVFAEELASLADFYVNDAFGTCHRAHASNVGVSRLLPSALGFLVEKEVKALGEILEDPHRPFIAILGGAKVSDKIGVIENLIPKVDGLIIVGAMAYTFLRAKSMETGKSLVEEDKIGLAENLLKQAEKEHTPIYLPVDVVVADNMDGDGIEIVSVDKIPEDKMGLDIGPASLKEFGEILKDAETVFWNGPAGVFEKPEFAKGTFGLAKILAENPGMTVIGGGDSAAAVEKSGLADRMSHISTGGGASLRFMEGKKLPGIAAIEDKEA